VSAPNHSYELDWRFYAYVKKRFFNHFADYNHNFIDFVPSGGLGHKKRHLALS